MYNGRKKLRGIRSSATGYFLHRFEVRHFLNTEINNDRLFICGLFFAPSAWTRRLRLCEEAAVHATSRRRFLLADVTIRFSLTMLDLMNAFNDLNRLHLNEALANMIHDLYPYSYLTYGVPLSYHMWICLSCLKIDFNRVIHFGLFFTVYTFAAAAFSHLCESLNGR